MNESARPFFARLFLPHPLGADQVAQFFTRMAAGHGAGSAVILETRATTDGIVQLLGCGSRDASTVHHHLLGLIPGTTITGLDGYTRTSVYTAKRLSVDNRGLPLAVSKPETVTRALYTALSRHLHPGEALVLQLILGQARAPEHVPARVTDPRKRSLLQAVLAGPGDAPHEVRAALRSRAAEHRFEVTVRIGVTAATSDRRSVLGRELAAAIAVAEAPGARIDLKPDDPNVLNAALPHRWGASSLPVSELVALCGWPLGADDLPGLPPAHPKTLRADSTVETKQRVFAQSLAPGDSRRIGVSRSDALHHGIAIGSTGSGKTTLLTTLITADIAAGAPVLVIDPKAQMPDQILANVPKRRWKDVVIIDATAESPVGFNPLDASGRDPDVVADGILAVFKRTFADAWGPRTDDIFSASLRTLARAGLGASEPYTLVDIVRLWTDRPFRTQVVGPLVAAGDVGLASFWAWFDDLSPTQSANVLQSPLNKLRSLLLRPAAVKILGQRRPAFRLRDLFRDKKIVLVPLNEGLIGPLTAELIGSLVIAEVWQATQERAAEPGHENNIGFVYVDEADRFMSSLTVSLPDALARSRSLSVAWFLAVQYWAQMPVEMRAAVMHNARTKVVFKQDAYDDARMLAQLSPELEAEDFMSLGLYEVYVQPVAGGITSRWALANTLPPTPGLFDPAVVATASYRHHQPLAPARVDEQDAVDDLAGLPTSASLGPIGRTKRAGEGRL